jgi:hypothetical protein
MATPDGRLIASRLIGMDPQTGVYEQIAQEADDLAIAPDGAHMALRKGREISVSEIAARNVRWGEAFPIPDLFPGSPEGVSLVMAWISPTELLIEEDFVSEDFFSDCRIWNLGSRTWSTPAGGCPEGEMMDIYAISPGPDNLLAIYSVGEGHPAVTVARYTAARGQEKVDFPELSLYPFGPLEIGFTADARRIQLTTPCALELPGNPCEAAALSETEPAFRLYSWEGGVLSLVRADLPPNVVALADGHTLAWGEPGQVCVAESTRFPEKRCWPLP